MPTHLIAWRRVAGIAALEAAVTLGWTAYGICQPPLLEHFGVGSFLVAMAYAQGAIGGVLEPIVGAYSDRQLARTGSRFFLIGAGVIVAGLLFLAVAVTSRLSLSGAARWALPALMLLWVAAMDTFRSPALALLGRAASTAALPQASAVLMLISGLVGASTPLVAALVARIGEGNMFLIGGAVLGASALVLRRLARDAAPTDDAPPPTPPTRNLSTGLDASLVMVTGIGVALLQQVSSNVLLPALAAHHPTTSPATLESLVGVAAALATLPSARIVTALGPWRPLRLGILGLTAAVSLATIGGLTDVAALVAAAAGGLIMTAVIPYAFAAAPPDGGGRFLGCYFGGVSVGYAATAAADLHARPTLLLLLVVGALAALAAVNFVERRR